jgi:hypothetical protein
MRGGKGKRDAKLLASSPPAPAPPSASAPSAAIHAPASADSDDAEMDGVINVAVRNGVSVTARTLADSAEGVDVGAGVGAHLLVRPASERDQGWLLSEEKFQQVLGVLRHVKRALSLDAGAGVGRARPAGVSSGRVLVRVEQSAFCALSLASQPPALAQTQAQAPQQHAQRTHSGAGRGDKPDLFTPPPAPLSPRAAAAAAAAEAATKAAVKVADEAAAAAAAAATTAAAEAAESAKRSLLLPSQPQVFLPPPQPWLQPPPPPHMGQSRQPWSTVNSSHGQRWFGCRCRDS